MIITFEDTERKVKQAMQRGMRCVNAVMVACEELPIDHRRGVIMRLERRTGKKLREIKLEDL